MARRGRPVTALGAEIDVGRAAQRVQVVLHRELLAQALADPVLHIVEGQLALREPLRELEDDELGPLRVRAYLEYRLPAGGPAVPDRPLAVRRQLGHGQ